MNPIEFTLPYCLLRALREGTDTHLGLQGLCSHDGVVGPCRENTEGEYSGLEHEVVPDVVESLKVGLYAASLLCLMQDLEPTT